jgi:hypothetical protein
MAICAPVSNIKASGAMEKENVEKIQKKSRKSN